MKHFCLLFFLITVAVTVNSQIIKLKITGVTSLAGEEVLAFETGDTIPASSTYGGGGGGSTVRYETIKIKKLKDVSTNELFKRSINGLHTGEATFEFYDLNNVLFYQIVIKDFTVNHFSYLSPECPGCAKLFHQLWFDYKQIEVTDVASGNVVKFNRLTNAFY